MATQVTMNDGAHPLAHRLARELAASNPNGRVLLLGIGSGRNVPPLLEAGLRVDAIEDDAGRARAAAERFSGEPRVRVVRARYTAPLPIASGCDGALATHALLHGTPGTIASAALALANRLRAGAALFVTLGCTDDPRFGRGTRIDDATFAPDDGDEAGVAHAYFREDEAARVLAPFAIVSIERIEAGALVGRWAHGAGERIVHWFVRALRP